MNKSKLILLFFLGFVHGYSQEFYFQTGKNFTKYTFVSADGTKNSDFQTNAGSSFEVGYLRPFKNKKFSYNLGLVLDEYNAIYSSNSNIYRWQTEYIGVQNSLQCNFIETTYFSVDAKVALNLDTIIYGKQEINGVIYDLLNEKEFSGLMLVPMLGIQVKSKLSEFAYLSLGYNYSKSFNISNRTDEKVFFNTSQIQIGIHLKINKKVKKEILINQEL